MEVHNYCVSVVIVCMNNYGQLKDCLDSIKKFTKEVSYEVFLVAYFFSEENLRMLYEEFPWVKVIISNEIRGFSENNNLALHQAQGKYCFILNDDTYFSEDVISKLFCTMEGHNNIAAMSPQVLNIDGTLQFSGFPPHTWINWILILFKFKRDLDDKEKRYTNSVGLSKTYDLLGACIFIRTNVLKKMGYLDERYFYGPEDRALTTKMNREGYECWVDNNIKLTHLGGATGGITTRTLLATRPSNRKGWVIYHGGDSVMRRFILKVCIFVNSFIWLFGWIFKTIMGNKNAKLSLLANINVCKTIFNNETPKETFTKFYKKR